MGEGRAPVAAVACALCLIRLNTRHITHCRSTESLSNSTEPRRMHFSGGTTTPLNEHPFFKARAMDRAYLHDGRDDESLAHEGGGGECGDHGVGRVLRVDDEACVRV